VRRRRRGRRGIRCRRGSRRWSLFVDAGLPRTRATRTRALARAVAQGEVRLDGSISLEQLIGSLTARAGADVETAHDIALRLGGRDAFPAIEAMPIAAGAGFRDVMTASLERSERWRPWRALAATHLRLADGALQVDQRLRGAA
jgi:AraC family transcriptional regulator of adaptative response / DNA-3-methyladenine glycosylase II